MIIPLLRLQSLSYARPLALRLCPLRTPTRIFASPKSTTIMDTKTADDVLKFWFEDLSGPADWFRSCPECDATIRDKFQHTLDRAAAGELEAWRKDADGALAEIIVLDQFSRNLFRDDPKTFAQDGMALVLAQEAISKGYDQEMDPQKKLFLYMPFMHSESRVIHERSLELFQDLADKHGMEMNLEFAKKHKDVVDRFGRYPYRNEILGRESTPEEEAFLNDPGSKWW